MVLALTTSFNLTFANENFDWFMCCQMRDLIDHLETLSSRACTDKKDISQVIKKYLPSSIMLLERYAQNI